MKLPKLEDLNNDQFLDEAFEAEHNDRLVQAARMRRNIYLWLFLTGIACLFITLFTEDMTMSVLSLFLATISLVVMTKYDTQLRFLQTLRMREKDDKNMLS